LIRVRRLDRDPTAKSRWCDDIFRTWAVFTSSLARRPVAADGKRLELIADATGDASTAST
jgi:hypothetical protein